MNPLLELADAITAKMPFLNEGIFAIRFFGSSIGELLLCIASILFFTIAGKIIMFAFQKYVHAIAKKTSNEFDDLVVEVLSTPLFWFFPLIGFYIGLHFLELSQAYIDLANGVLFAVAALLITWVFLRIIDGAINFFLIPLAEKTKSDLDDQLIPVLRNTLKAGTLIMVLLVVLSHFGIDIIPAIAGLGIGGLALAFAAKETIADVFGGISIFTSRPFKLGDWVKVAGVSGTVKEVGLRHTRIKALDKRLVTIPNSKVASSIIENISKAPRKMTEITIGLTYDTSVKEMGKAMKILREIINERDDCEDEPLIVFKEFADSSVNIMMRYWIIKKSEFMRIRSEVNTEIKKRFDKAGLNFAFPTQTIYLEK